VLPPVICYISKIFPREDLLEVCDRSFSIKVRFEPMENLKAIVMSQPYELNILGLIGKQLFIQTSEMCFYDGKLCLLINSCEIKENRGWDRSVPP